jgi:hypothetical protein
MIDRRTVSFLDGSFPKSQIKGLAPALFRSQGNHTVGFVYFNELAG